MKSSPSKKQRSTPSALYEALHGPLQWLSIGAIALAASSCASAPTWLTSLFNGGNGEEETLSPEELAHRAEHRKMMDEYAIETAVRGRDVVRGMTREDVRSAWGEPRSREVAGDERSGNERWIYTLGVSSRWSLAPKKYVYFERGQVVGWETQ